MSKQPNSSFRKNAEDRGNSKGNAGRKGTDGKKPFKKFSDRPSDETRSPGMKTDRSFRGRSDKNEGAGKKEWKEKDTSDRPKRSKQGFDDFKPERKPRDKDKFATQKKEGAQKKFAPKEEGRSSFGDFKSERKPRNKEGFDTQKREDAPKKFVRKEESRSSFGDFKPERKPRNNERFDSQERENTNKKFTSRGERKSSEDFRPRKKFQDKDRFDKPRTEGEPKKFRQDGERKITTDKKTGDKERKDRRDPAALRPQVFDDKVYGELEDADKKVFRPGRTTRDNRRIGDNKREETEIGEAMTLNKYIAHSGQCSRRDAAAFVKEGKVRVNGELVLEPGYRVAPGDQVTLSGKKLTPQKGLVYILLNKPKGFITTTEDPQERKTVMDLVANAEVDRLYPVGRLDRNTTGLLLMTNDGALAHKLSHPSYNIKKVYQVTLDKNLTNTDYQKIAKGLELEDGKIEVDEIAYLENRNELGLEIHSGRNRIVRRIFESLGYEVEKLDRVMYAGLTKKNLPRGKWRFLAEKEVILLKHFKI